MIVTSLGRTGTRFFWRLFDRVLSGATVLHEPDIFNLGNNIGIWEIPSQLRNSGFLNLVVWRTIGRWSLIRLSDRRLCGRITARKAAKLLDSQRAGFIESKPGNAYVESNAGYYGLLDLLPSVFSNYRAIYLVRDGRTWVRSQMNWDRAYSKGFAKKLVAHSWPKASDVPGDPWAEYWPNMSRFQKLCWAWARMNSFALNAANTDTSIRIFRFEDVFGKIPQDSNLTTLLRFALEPIDVHNKDIRVPKGMLNKKIHSSAGDFPEWHDWSPRQRSQFIDICGELMRELSYDMTAVER